MTIMALHEAFGQMVKELEAHPLVEVTHQSGPSKFSKTGKSTLENALKRVDRGVPRPLRELMAALGGYCVRWNLLDQPLAKKRKPNPFLAAEDLERQPKATGCIAFPLGTVFLNRPHEGLVWFDFDTDDKTETVNGIAYPRASFRKSLRLFDVFDNYYDVAWASPPGGPEGFILGRDAHADYDTRIVSVETYLKLLLATRGSTALRVAFFEGRYTLPEKPPSLDELLGALRETPG